MGGAWFDKSGGEIKERESTSLSLAVSAQWVK